MSRDRIGPSYRQLSGTELRERAQEAGERIRSCSLCPQRCRAQRQQGEKGLCATSDHALVSEFGPHWGEEAPLTGRRGSGTIFFAGCNLSCVFCQNYDISHQARGRPVDAKQLASIMLRLETMGCHNINLVSPSHVVNHCLEALIPAVEQGLNLPIVYNSGGYDCPDTLKLLDSVVDIYMPDMKYGDNTRARRYSGVEDYVEVNQEAVKAMHRQVGDLVLDDRGMARSGLIIRHLLLPAGTADTENVLAFIARELGANTYLNVMNQYSPHYLARRHKELQGRVSRREYHQALELAARYGLTRLA